MKTILITGGTGFIGSHACVALAQSGHQLVILDNLCNSRADVIDRRAPFAVSARHLFRVAYAIAQYLTVCLLLTQSARSCTWLGAGDIAKCWADTTVVQPLLNWKARRVLEQMCTDTRWWWQGSVALRYLQGYEEYEQG